MKTTEPLQKSHHSRIHKLRCLVVHIHNRYINLHPVLLLFRSDAAIQSHHIQQIEVGLGYGPVRIQIGAPGHADDARVGVNHELVLCPGLDPVDDLAVGWGSVAIEGSDLDH